MARNNKDRAVLRSSVAPDQATKERLQHVLEKKYGQPVQIEWEKDSDLQDGFILQVGTDIYDWSIEGRLRQFKSSTLRKER